MAQMGQASFQEHEGLALSDQRMSGQAFFFLQQQPLSSLPIQQKVKKRIQYNLNETLLSETKTTISTKLSRELSNRCDKL